MSDYIILNDGSPDDETSLGAIDVFASIVEAKLRCEHWVSEQPGMRFYDARGGRLIAIHHGDHATFHFEMTGTVFEGFEDLIFRDARRQGLDPAASGSLDAVLCQLCEHSRVSYPGFMVMGWRWFIPPPLRNFFRGKGEKGNLRTVDRR